jgi:tRNA (guanine-N7-)-methyltransferase
MTENKRNKPKTFRNFYGRLKGRGLRNLQQEILNNQLNKLSIPSVSQYFNPDRKHIEVSDLFHDLASVNLEIGFGGGEHLVYQAKRNPNIGFIGCEPYINAVAMLAGKLSQLDLENVRIYPGDVRDLFDVLPDDSIGNVFLLYPDPWPKKRHHRRRFVTSEYLIDLNRVMKTGAVLRIATDIPDYVRQSLQEVMKHNFSWMASDALDWRECWSDWISTRYEKKPY